MMAYVVCSLNYGCVEYSMLQKKVTLCNYNYAPFALHCNVHTT